MSIQVVVDGQWLSTIAGWGELQWAHSADGGCKTASWRMDLPPTYANARLSRGKRVVIKLGPVNVWQGILVEPDMDDGWTFNAVGLADEGASFLCFDALGNTTSIPDVAIDQAITRGLPWKRPTSLSSTAYAATTSTDALNYVSELMNAYANSVGQRWGVDADAQAFLSQTQTVPTWHMKPGTGRFGLADDDYASDVFVRYLDATAGYATATAGDSTARGQFGRREYPVDATSLGILDATSASAVGTGLLAKGMARQGYTNGVTATKYQLTTPGGTAASLPLVRDGQLVRMFGVLNEQGQPTQYLDWVIGETSYEAGSETIGLTPVGLVARTLGDVLSVTGSAA